MLLTTPLIVSVGLLVYQQVSERSIEPKLGPDVIPDIGEHAQNCLDGDLPIRRFLVLPTYFEPFRIPSTARVFTRYSS